MKAQKQKQENTPKTKAKQTQRAPVLFQTRIQLRETKKLDKLQKKLGIATRTEFLRRILISTVICPTNAFPELLTDD